MEVISAREQDVSRIAGAIRAVSDIMNDGSNGDPAKICDGISIGIGCQAVAVKLGSVAAPKPLPPNPCGPV